MLPLQDDGRAHTVRLVLGQAQAAASGAAAGGIDE